MLSLLPCCGLLTISCIFLSQPCRECLSFPFKNPDYPVTTFGRHFGSLGSNVLLAPLSGLKVLRRHRIVSFASAPSKLPASCYPRSRRNTSQQSPLSKPYHSNFRAKYALNRRVRKVFYYHVLGFASTFFDFFRSISSVLPSFSLF